MVLENACKYKNYLWSVFDEMGFYGSFEVVDNNINLNINELLKQLQNALNSNTHFSEQVELSLKGIVRILEVLLSLDFFKNANEIDSSLKNSIEWLNNAGESLKNKMKEYESFFNAFQYEHAR